MPNFNYEAIDKNNQIVKKQKVANSKEEIASFLKLRGYTIISIDQQKELGFNLTNFFQSFSSGISLNEKANFARNLSTMIKSGLPISESIGVIADDTKSKKFKSILIDIKYGLESGRPLSKSMEKYPDVFDKVFLSLISAGEMSGKISEILTNLYEQMTKNINFRNKIISALAYPLVVLVALGIMGITMLIVVVPKISEVFFRMNIELPVALKVLNLLSLLFVKWWFITIPVIIAIIVFIIFFIRSNYWKKVQSSLLRAIPLFSNLSRSYDMSHITSTLSLLLKSGLPITDSIRIVADGVIDTKLKNILMKCEKQVREGKPISKAFAEYPKEIPSMLVKVSRVGEKSGKMDQVLAELAQYYDEQVDFALRNFSDLIEPILMLFVGAIVAILVLSIISPIYKLVGSFSNG